MVIKNCIICDDNSSAEIYINHKDFVIIHCKKCNLCYQQTIRQVGSLEAIYNNIYESSPYVIKNKYYWKNKMKACYQEISRYKKKPGNLFDIGCSYGFLMEFFISKGWNATGMDICENAITYARKQGLDCYMADIANFRHNNKFDVIVMDNVLEHFENPLEYLKLVKNFLAKDGIIYIRVPNVESVMLSSKIQSFLGDLKPFEHLFYFSKDTLNLLFDKAGLKGFMKTDGQASIGNLLNCYFRSKVVLGNSWQNLNYRVPSDKKKFYFLLKHIYGEIMSILDNIRFGSKDREIVAIASLE
ncbi:MAG: class I SAM-dependent methyltransferase [Candidatus Omnitrophica bacterium]|nr:class I SAM-dependent methyltransferase [Candidatus Omnitrophota bacterium]MDD5352462.1 class I SAM-dependent methyltransferase [Candidatus Omnitrophota bacterium]MDD5550060.1 class I SAM-dependent methyltransferase [Candidatus Omnitrophota bacterium]